MLDEDEIFVKSGPELFKELLRIYPMAEVDDYYKNGMWKDDVMKMDFTLINAHRREAGSPDPVPLEEVQVPDLPKAVVPMASFAVGRPAIAGTRPAGAPVMARAGVMPTAAPSAEGVGGSPVAELRLIALFIAKWKLEATSAKMTLAKLSPARRRHIITNFKPSGAVSGAAATQALVEYYQVAQASGLPAPQLAQGTCQAACSGAKVAPLPRRFIANCEKTGSWGAASPAAATAPAAGLGAPRPAGPTAAPGPAFLQAMAPGPVPMRAGAMPARAPGIPAFGGAAGVKRPYAAPAYGQDPNKRPRFGVPLQSGPQAAPSGAASHAELASRIAAIRAVVPGGGRPPGARQPPGRPQGASEGSWPKPAGFGLTRPASAPPRPAVGAYRPAGAAAAGPRPAGSTIIRNLLQRY
ncbi:unnamed protein product [Prorocentrum cordatum]|uniref:Uncharacterized protein n=1 Tax=Prorocentrum cordatum TaxID=2364126 RepID=A0ABN9URG6_9DINO|nr:unnamed protein product [Polarella glacialis]